MNRQFYSSAVTAAPAAATAWCLAVITLLSGCAGTGSQPVGASPPAAAPGANNPASKSANNSPGASNPLPAQAFARFGRVWLKTVALAAGARGRAADVLKIDASLKNNLAARLALWNARPANGRTLVIQPVVEEVSFKKAGKAASAGPLDGSPGILIRVQIKDEHGQLIANPAFFQRTDALGAGFTMGVHDNLMIKRIADLTTDYILANFDKPVGGASGAGDKVLEAR